MRTSALLLAGLLLGCHRTPSSNDCNPDEWTQWGRTAAHSGRACVPGQPLQRAMVDIVVDPSVAQERAENADHDLLVHYQSPLVSGDDVFVAAKSGYVSCVPPGSGSPPPCGPDAWDRQTWVETRYTWIGSELLPVWTVVSDWKPPPDGNHLGGWEPVFHAAIFSNFVYLPGAGGSVVLRSRGSGALIRRFDPFSGDPLSFVSGPLAVDAKGNVVWTVVRLSSATAPWTSDARGYVVRSSPDGAVLAQRLDVLMPDAPSPTAQCEIGYSMPDPPAPQPVLPLEDDGGVILPPPTVPCGTQRPPINATPAIGRDGTIFVVSRAHFAERWSYLLALRPDLTLRWSASLRGLLHDGCGVSVPKDETSLHCHRNAPDGIDPHTGLPPAARADDDSTASPVALPDGRVLYGAYTGYNGSRGHTLLFSADGKFVSSYDFGWDTTPSWFEHDGTYSIVLKDNHYGTGPFFITQLDANLGVEWKYQSTNTRSCKRGPNGVVTCKIDHPNGFEWCVNALAVDRDGVAYANSEDGNLYAIGQGGVLKQSLFLESALGAAYTPLAIDAKGRIYTQNAGHLYVVGGP
jgi:hypothetical protein